MTARNAYLKRKYGITEKDYLKLSYEQDGRCFICHRAPKKRRLSVDHDHALGRVRHAVRGLLCHMCNRGLTYYRDNPERLQRAAEYLRRDNPFKLRVS